MISLNSEIRLRWFSVYKNSIHNFSSNVTNNNKSLGFKDKKIDPTIQPSTTKDYLGAQQTKIQRTTHECASRRASHSPRFIFLPRLTPTSKAKCHPRPSLLPASILALSLSCMLFSSSAPGARHWKRDEKPIAGGKMRGGGWARETVVHQDRSKMAREQETWEDSVTSCGSLFTFYPRRAEIPLAAAFLFPDPSFHQSSRGRVIYFYFLREFSSVAVWLLFIRPGFMKYYFSSLMMFFFCRRTGSRDIFLGNSVLNFKSSCSTVRVACEIKISSARSSKHVFPSLKSFLWTRFWKSRKMCFFCM